MLGVSFLCVIWINVDQWQRLYNSNMYDVIRDGTILHHTSHKADHQNLLTTTTAASCSVPQYNASWFTTPNLLQRHAPHHVRNRPNEDDHRPDPFFNPSTGFTLNCPCTTTTTTATIRNNVKLHLVYHVGRMRNWKEIVHDQLTTLQTCGTGALATTMTITYTMTTTATSAAATSEDDDNKDNNHKDNKTDHQKAQRELRELLAPFAFVRQLDSLRIVPGSTQPPWEAAAMDVAHDICTKTRRDSEEAHNGNNNQNANSNNDGDQEELILYFHNKGASKYTARWYTRQDMEKVWTYSRSLYWRKYMEYFLLERPGWCWTLLTSPTAATTGRAATSTYNNNDNHQPPASLPGTCGVQFTKGNHYSGNFWMASCRYVRHHLESMTSLAQRRTFRYLAAEFWVAGKGKTKYPRQYYNNNNIHASLLDKNYSHSLYRHLIVPSEYVITNETRAWELVRDAAAGAAADTNDMTTRTSRGQSPPPSVSKRLPLENVLTSLVPAVREEEEE